MDKKLKELRSQSKVISPNIIIGKNGLNDNVIGNIKKELKNHKMVKIKILGTYMEDKDKSEVFAEIAEKTDAKMVHTIGFTISLTRK